MQGFMQASFRVPKYGNRFMRTRGGEGLTCGGFVNQWWGGGGRGWVGGA